MTLESKARDLPAQCAGIEPEGSYVPRNRNEGLGPLTCLALSRLVLIKENFYRQQRKYVLQSSGTVSI